MRTSRLSSALAMLGVLVAGGVAIADDDPTTAPFDFIIIVEAGLQPRTISTSFVGDAVPTVTIERNGTATLKLDGDQTFSPMVQNLTTGNLFVNSFNTGGTPRAVIQWSNPEGQKTARIDVERLATADDEAEDLEPFRVSVGFDNGNPQTFTGREKGAKTVLSDAAASDRFLKPGGTHTSANTQSPSRVCLASGCDVRLGVEFAPGKGVADLGAGRTITSRFIFTILDA